MNPREVPSRTLLNTEGDLNWDRYRPAAREVVSDDCRDQQRFAEVAATRKEAVSTISAATRP
jgi:hypothetical protein